MKKIILNFFLVLSIFTLELCKDEPLCNDPTNPKCPNYDPCYGKKLVTADFEMSEIYPFVMPSYVGNFTADIAFARGRIGFRPLNFDSSANYIWILGSEIINEDNFVRDFRNTQQTLENNIPITLIIEKNPDLMCFPYDDGRDTIIKYIHFVESPCEYLSSGDFKVLFEGETDSVIVGIRNWNHTGGKERKILDSCSYRNAVFLGFDHKKNPRDTSWDGISGFQFYSKFVLATGEMGGSHGCAYNGFVKVNPFTLKVEAKYQILQFDGTFSEKYLFNGRKIN